MAKKKTATSAWPAEENVTVPLKKLVPYARNARLHSPEQVAQIRGSMREFGWTMRILLDEKNGIIAGHGRVLAAAAEVADGDKRFADAPCCIARGWSEAKKRAYILADNKLTLNATWDNDLLAGELAELRDAGYDLSITGFGEDEVAVLLNGWDSDIDPLEAHGENLDGIESVIKVGVMQHDAEQARTLIEKALKKAGVTFDLS